MIDQNRWNEFRKGNQTVLGDIFLTYYEDLFRYSKRWLRDEEQIKDLIQDLFFKLWIKRENLGETDNIKAYLITTCRNHLINLKNQPHKIAFQAITDSEWFRYNTADFSDPDEKDTEKNKQLIDCLNQLPLMQREAIYLKYFEGLDIDEIAVVMNQKNQSVRNNLHRAMSKLREKMLFTFFLSAL